MATVLKANVVSQRAGQNVNFAEGLAAGNQIARTILENKRMKDQLQLERDQFNFEKDQQVFANIMSSIDRAAEHSLNGYRDAFDMFGGAFKSSLEKLGVDPAASQHFLNRVSEMDMDFESSTKSLLSRVMMYDTQKGLGGDISKLLYDDSLVKPVVYEAEPGKIEAQSEVTTTDASQAQYEPKDEPIVKDDMFIQKPQDAATGRPTSRSEWALQQTPRGGDQENITSRSAFAAQQVKPTDEGKAQYISESVTWDAPGLPAVDMKDAVTNYQQMGYDVKSAEDITNAYLLKAYPQGHEYWAANGGSRVITDESPQQYHQDYERIKNQIINQNKMLFNEKGQLREKGEVVKETIASYNSNKLTVRSGATKKMSSQDILKQVAMAYGVPKAQQEQWFGRIKHINNIKDLNELDGKTLQLPLGPSQLAASRVQESGTSYQKSYINTHADKASSLIDKTPSEVRERLHEYYSLGIIPKWSDEVSYRQQRPEEIENYNNSQKSTLSKAFDEGTKVLTFAERAAMRDQRMNEREYGIDPYTTTDPRYLRQALSRLTGVQPMSREQFAQQIQAFSKQQGQAVDPQAAQQLYEKHLNDVYRQQINIASGLSPEQLSASSVKQQLSTAEYYSNKAISEKYKGEAQLQLLKQQAGGGDFSFDVSFTEEGVRNMAKFLAASGPEYFDDGVKLLGNWASYQNTLLNMEESTNPQLATSMTGKTYKEAVATLEPYMEKDGTKDRVFTSTFYEKLKKGEYPEHVLKAWDFYVKHTINANPQLWKAVPEKMRDGGLLWMLQRIGSETEGGTGGSLDSPERAEADAFIEQKMGQ